MALRRRERRTERSKIDATPPWEVRHHAEPEPTGGPFDVRDEPDDDITRIDLGALRVPVWPGMEVRLDLNEAQQVQSVTLVTPKGQMQLGAFAAPRNEGIWDEVRAELRSSLEAQGGVGRDQPGGPHGVELVGKLQDQGKQVPVRFVGIDGPRWFVRAMLIGQVAVDRAASAVFEQVLRGLVVVRGSEPLPVREPIPLTMPKEAVPDTPDEDESS